LPDTAPPGIAPRKKINVSHLEVSGTRKRVDRCHRFASRIPASKIECGACGRCRRNTVNHGDFVHTDGITVNSYAGLWISVGANNLERRSDVDPLRAMKCGCGQPRNDAAAPRP
jgi:hypothetical protein